MAGGTILRIPNATSVRELMELFFGIKMITRVMESDVSVGTSAVQLGTYDNTRIAYVLSNSGSVTVAIGFSNAVTTTTGIQVPAGGTLFSWWLSDGETVSQDIWGIASGSGNGVHVAEYVLTGL